MSQTACASPDAALHRLVVEAEPHANVLLRLLEPFVIHDVLPHRIDCMAGGDALSVELEFSAPADLALRLRMRLEAMVPVRDVELAPLSPRIDAAA